MIDRFIVALSLVLPTGAQSSLLSFDPPSPTKNCTIPAAERSRLLALPYGQFDTDNSQFAWRNLNGRSCTDEALEMLVGYVAAHSAVLTPDQQSEAAFHAGQALTFANRNQEAAAYFEKALTLAANDEWSTYVRAHLAYSRGDLESLRRARDHYAVVAPQSMRLGFLDGLLGAPQNRTWKLPTARNNNLRNPPSRSGSF